MTLQIFWPKPGNPREGGQKGGTNGREGGGGEGGSRAKPGNQLVLYKHYHCATCTNSMAVSHIPVTLDSIPPVFTA